MATLRSIKKRIKSVQSTEKVTRAMRTVSVSKYNRALTRNNSFEAYLDACRRLAGCLGGYAGELSRRPEEAKRVCYVLITGNRGLCGSFNIDLMRFYQSLAADDPREKHLIVCGRWAQNFCRANEIPVERCFEAPDVADYQTADAVGAYIRELYISGAADEIYLVYQKFVNILTQTPTAERFLPLETGEGEVSADYIFLPDREGLLETLIDRCLRANVYGAMLSSSTGAQGATLMAMRTASDNSAEMLEKLELQLNRLRQSAVTSEILEISSSASVRE